MSEADLEAKLLEAHARHDGVMLAQLYAKAAAKSEQDDQIDEACFRYTQAYVFALENGLTSLASDIHRQLLSYGREE